MVALLHLFQIKDNAMGRRKGRKFPTDRKKERKQRELVDKGTKEQLDRFELLVGRKKRNNKDSAAENPVRVLHARGYLSDMQASALLGYCELYWHYVYQDFRRMNATAEAKELVGNGSLCLPIYIQEAKAEEKEGLFKSLDDSLQRAGKLPRALVRKVAIEELIDANNLQINFPIFFVRQYVCEQRHQEFKLTRVEMNELAALRAGADALMR